MPLLTELEPFRFPISTKISALTGFLFQTAVSQFSPDFRWPLFSTSVRFRWFHLSLRQISMSMHGAAQHDIIAVRFIEEDVLLEWTKHDDEPPVTQTRMGKSGARTEPRMSGEQMAGSYQHWRDSAPQCPDPH
jgi:hypothetical protein